MRQLVDGIVADMLFESRQFGSIPSSGIMSVS